MNGFPRQIIEDAGAAGRVGRDRDPGVSCGQPRTIVNARKPARWQGGTEFNGQPRTIVDARKPARWQGGTEFNGLL
jgi:hypothetical protein